MKSKLETSLRTTVARRTDGIRQSNALASIMAFQNHDGQGQSDTVKRASMNLGGKGDAAELAIENDRLKTTLMILNQKMKMVEDSDDINEKWKSQVQSKEG